MSDSSKVLVQWPKFPLKNVEISFVIFFMHLKEIIEYASKNLKNADSFVLVVSGEDLHLLLQDPVYWFPHVQTIFVYYVEPDKLQRDRAIYQGHYKKLDFYPASEIEKIINEKLMVHLALDPSGPIRRELIHSASSSLQQRVGTKIPRNSTCKSSQAKSSTHPKTVHRPVIGDDDVETSLICPYCELIMYEPYQASSCGHRFCKACIEKQLSNK